MRVVLADPSAQVPYYVRALSGALATAGHEIAVATAGDLYYDPGPMAAGVQVRRTFGRLVRTECGPIRPAERRVLRRGLRALGYGPEMVQFSRWVTSEQWRVVHFQWSLAPVLDAFVVGRLKSRGLIAVHTAHNVLPHHARNLHSNSYRRLYRAVDRLIVHSRAAAVRLSDLGISADRVSVVPMAADIPTRSCSREEARQILDLPVDRPMVLFFGQIRPYKGLDVLIAALPGLVAEVPDALLVVAGHVAGGARQVDKLRSDIVAGGVGDAAVLRPGYVDNDSADNYFAAADVVALPYTSTDDSAVLCKARGHERAVVASSVGGIPEALAQGGGLLVEPKDPHALAVALASILTEREIREAHERSARQSAREWTWANVAAETARVYDDAAIAAIPGSSAAAKELPG